MFFACVLKIIVGIQTTKNAMNKKDYSYGGGSGCGLSDQQNTKIQFEYLSNSLAKSTF